VYSVSMSAASRSRACELHAGTGPAEHNRVSLCSCPESKLDMGAAESCLGNGLVGSRPDAGESGRGSHARRRCSLAGVTGLPPRGPSHSVFDGASVARPGARAGLALLAASALFAQSNLRSTSNR
jgi:hypothetical protein